MFLSKQENPFRAAVGNLSWPGAVTWFVAILVGLLFVWLPLRMAAGAAFGIALVLLIIIQPLFGLTLALLAGPLGALEQLFSGIVSLDSGQILLFLTILGWLGRGLACRSFNFPLVTLGPPLAMFGLMGFISILGAASAAAGIKELLKWLEIGVIMLLVADLGRLSTRHKAQGLSRSVIGGPPRTVWLVGMLQLAGLSQALVGIWQFGLRGVGPEHFLVLGSYYRAYGTYEQPNPFGGFMNLSLLLAIGISVGLVTAWWLWMRHHKGMMKQQVIWCPSWRALWATLLAGLAVGITGLALLFSWSRGAWLGFAAGAAGMLLFLPRKRINGLLLLGAILILALFAYGTGLLPASIATRFTGFTEDFFVGDVRGVDINDENYSVLERQAHWQAGLAMLRDDIWLGIGFGNYAEAYAEYALLNWPDALGHAHNYYINLLAEVGILGLTAYLLFWVAVVWQTVRLLRKLAWPDRGIVLGLLGAWIALAAHHLVDKLYVNNIYIHLGVMLGLLQLMEWYTVKLQEDNVIEL